TVKVDGYFVAAIDPAIDDRNVVLFVAEVVCPCQLQPGNPARKRSAGPLVFKRTSFAHFDRPTSHSGLGAGNKQHRGDYFTDHVPLRFMNASRSNNITSCSFFSNAPCSG